MIKRFFRKLFRALSYFKVGWQNHDWDFHYVYVLLHFKLKRIEEELYGKNAIHIPIKNEKQSLRICIKLLARLIKNDYNYFWSEHTKKWGTAEFIDIDRNGQYTKIKVGVPGLSGVDSEKERNEFNLACIQDDLITVRDEKLLFNILNKYHKYWWS